MADTNPNHIRTILRQKSNGNVDPYKEVYPKTTIDQLYNESGDSHFNDESFAKPIVASTGISLEAIDDDPNGAREISVKISDLIPAILDLAYPIGSIYTMYSETSVSVCPIQTSLGGTWERIEDTFLLASGNNYAINTEGGAATQTLVTSNLPAHQHSITLTSTGSTTNTSKNLIGGFTSSQQRANVDIIWNHYGIVSKNGDSSKNSSKQDVEDTGQSDTTINTHIDATHSHNVTVTGSGNTESVGENTAFSIMPPYLTVYMWKRIA